MTEPFDSPVFDAHRPAPPEDLRLAPDDAFRERDGGFWVFGYGSLMWRPGFSFVESRPVVLKGYTRAFCLWSLRYRGTPEAPGLVLGLKSAPGAETHGVAFRVAGADAAPAREYLIAREMVTAAYHEAVVAVTPIDGPADPVADVKTAITYVIDKTHRQYAGALSLEQQARIIATRVGGNGRNCEYLHNTLAHLIDFGVPREELTMFEELAARVRALQSDLGVDPSADAPGEGAA